MQKGSINRVILVGHLGGDPESRYLPSGDAVTNFSLATNESWKKKDGEYEDQTEGHKCVSFGKQAESASKQLKKGQMIYFEGRLRTRSWEDKDGVKRYTTEVVGDMFTMLGRKPEMAWQEASSNGGGESEDDLPF